MVRNRTNPKDVHNKLRMNNEEMKDLSIELMKCSESVFLSTINEEGFPNIRAMNNLRSSEQYENLNSLFIGHDDDFMILLSTNTSSEKIKHIQNNPKVSAYYKKPGVWQGVTFIGEAEFVEDPEIKKAIWQEGFKKFYPLGFDDPDHTVLRIYPIKAKGWNSVKLTKFQFNIR
ncbi:MAG: pyridoxamine 5'-phosphate oxidase family protein [Candidatus Lokiarchaeota archaeon]|nr:pyridoxamine 5'-phosphate oxidase family protein [Candidatus Lokiarchaeota archaeon]